MLLVVVLFFGVACSALPTSDDGESCLYNCYLAVAIPGADKPCERVAHFRTCWKPCPTSRQDAVVQQVTRLFEKLCSASVSEEQRENYWHSYADLHERLDGRASQCEDPAPKDDETRCKNAAICLLGSALDELKADYPEDVVTAVADMSKLWQVYYLKDHKSPPEACSFLYEPYKA